MVDIKFYAETDATFTFIANGIMCPVDYQIHTHCNKQRHPLSISLTSSNDPSPCVEYLTSSYTFWSRFLCAFFLLVVSWLALIKFVCYIIKLTNCLMVLHKP